MELKEAMTDFHNVLDKVQAQLKKEPSASLETTILPITLNDQPYLLYYDRGLQKLMVEDEEEHATRLTALPTMSRIQVATNIPDFLVMVCEERQVVVDKLVRTTGHIEQTLSELDNA